MRSGYFGQTVSAHASHGFKTAAHAPFPAVRRDRTSRTSGSDDVTSEYQQPHMELWKSACESGRHSSAMGIG